VKIPLTRVENIAAKKKIVKNFLKEHSYKKIFFNYRENFSLS